MLFYYKFLFILLLRELKHSHEVRIFETILKRSGSKKQIHCFFTNEILLFFYVTRSDCFVSFLHTEITSYLLILDVCFIYILKNLFIIV